MPPPPPPPGPPPTFNLANVEPPQLNKNEADGRNLLLASIRSGARLKKAVTNDRSAPAIDGKKSSSAENPSSGRMNGNPPGLGGLFAGGIPKLKPTGKISGGGAGSPDALLPPNKRNAAPSPPSNRGTPTASGIVPSLIQSHTPQVPNTSMKRFPSDRGPAPQPPPASNKPAIGGDITSGATTLPRRGAGPPLPTKPPNVKPSLGPRPSSAAKSIPKNTGNSNGPPSLPSRPPSLRRPASIGEHDYRTRNNIPKTTRAPPLPSANTVNGNNSSSPATTPTGGPLPPPRNFTAPSNLNQLGHPQKQMAPPPPLPQTAPGISQRIPPPPQRTATMLRPPGNKPPPPPVRSGGTGVHPPPPSSAPPPPPSCAAPFPPPPSAPSSAAPPPPPHRMTPSPLQQRMHGAPPVPSGVPPPPPQRNTSSRNSYHGVSTIGDDFESRFIHRFRNVSELPQPDPFINGMKTYPSKAPSSQRSRNPPPPPPGGAPTGPLPPIPNAGTSTMVQLTPKMWERQTTPC